MPPPDRTTTTTGPSFAEFAATRDPHLRDLLVEAHLGLAHQLARRFANRGETHEDLVQVASVALIHAVDRFDPDTRLRVQHLRHPDDPRRAQAALP